MGNCFGKPKKKQRPETNSNSNSNSKKSETFQAQQPKATPPIERQGSETSSTPEPLSVPNTSLDPPLSNGQPLDAPSSTEAPQERQQTPEATVVSEPSLEPQLTGGQPLEAPSSTEAPQERQLTPEGTAVSEPSLEPQSTEGQPPDAPPPKKRAFLCGVTYKNSKHELKGAINDVDRMINLLINKFGFLEDNMRVFTEEKKNPDLIPTKKNILSALQWLVEGSRSGDSLVFYFAGHGIQQDDPANEERDRLNEAICPVDFKKNGVILDNDINSIIVRPLKKGVTLHAIIDSCHSGTMLDLSHVYDRKTKEWEDNSPLSGARKDTDGGLAISISACKDSEEAVDTPVFTGNTMNGALTIILVKKLEEYPRLTYGELLDLIHEAIEDVRKEDGCLSTTNILKKMFGNKLLQRPQLSASERFNVYRTHFQL